jgi:anti-sigma B factor antagonist
LKNIRLKDEEDLQCTTIPCRLPDTAVSLLDIQVAATEAGPVMMLSGEADTTTLAQLEDALNTQLAKEVPILMVEVSGLRFADSATIGALVRAARALEDQGGRMELLNPQPSLTRVLSLLGVDEVLTVRCGTGPEPERPRLPRCRG